MERKHSVATPNEVRDAGARPEKSYLFFLTASIENFLFTLDVPGNELLRDGERRLVKRATSLARSVRVRRPLKIERKDLSSSLDVLNPHQVCTVSSL